MPTYQYACTECGKELEAVQKFSDDPLQTCPECQGRLRKVYSAVGVVFKGSGFYRNDSRSGSSSSLNSSSSSDSNGSTDSGTQETANSGSDSSSSSSSSSSAGSDSASSTGSTGSSGAAGPSDTKTAASANA